MGFAVYLDRLAFQKTDGTGMPIGDPEIVEKGGRVPDYVRPFEISALRAAGAIVDMGDDRDEDAGPLFAEQPPALPNPEVPPTLAGNPVLHSLTEGPEGLEAVRGASYPRGADTSEESDAERTDQSADRADQRPDGEDTQPVAVGRAVPKPSPRDSKQAWEDYAASRGMDRGEAESRTKAELIAAVEADESA